MVSPTKKDKGTERSHFVWRHYLQSFSDGNTLYVKEKKSECIFKAKTNNIAISKRNYILDRPISREIVEIYKELYVKNFEYSDIFSKILDELVAFINNDIEYFLSGNLQLKNIPNIIIKNIIDGKTLSRNQEEIFTFYENNFINIYKKLLSGDVQFYNDLVDDYNIENGYISSILLRTSNFFHIKAGDLTARLLNECGNAEKAKELRRIVALGNEELLRNAYTLQQFASENYFNIYYFLIFVITQNFRTSKIYNDMEMFYNNIKKYNEQLCKMMDYKSLIAISTHFQSYRLGLNLIREKYRIVLVKNNSHINFITSDNPVTNIFTLFKDNFHLEPDDLEFYYPLSPRVALIFSKQTCYLNTQKIQANLSDVINYNKLIVNSADKYIYADSQETLNFL